MNVDEEGLRDVLRRVEDAEKKNFEFAVGTQMVEENILPMFSVEGLGTIPVPVTIKDVNRLKKVSEPTLCCKSSDGMMSGNKGKKASWQMDAGHIIRHGDIAEIFFRQTVPSLAAVGLQQLGLVENELPLVEVRPHSVLIIERGGCAPRHRDAECEPGTFGVMFLQIPVKNGYEGGILKVNHQKESRIFDNSQNSKRCFYTTIFFTGCEHELTEVKQGWRIVFTFSLVWKWTRSLFVPLPADASLLFAAKEIERILSPWRLPDDAQRRCLAIPLEHNYTVANLSFAGLKGRDRLTASLLRSVNFVDLHLASVRHRMKPPTSTISNTDNPLLQRVLKKEEYRTECWVSSHTDAPLAYQGLEIDFDSEVVYPLFSRLQTNWDDTESRNSTNHEEESSLDCIYCQAFLVVWPKTSTIDLACRSGFMGALDLLECLARTLPAEEVLFVLGRTMTFCCANPQLVWCPSRKPSSPAGQVTYRLLQLCIDLDAIDQGLILLNLITDDLQTVRSKMLAKDQHDIATAEIEGLQTNEIAVTLAKLIALAGWDSCEEAIRRFLTPVRMAKQMEPLTVFVTSLISHGLHANAVYVANHLCPVLFASPLCWKSSTYNTAAEMVFRLEEWSESSNLLRVEGYLELARAIESTHLCQVIIYVHKKLSQFVKNIPGMKHFYQALSQILVERDFFSLRSVSEKGEPIVVNVFKCLLWLNDSAVLKAFLRQITMPTGRNNYCLQVVLASSAIWKVCLASEDGKNVLQMLIDSRLRELSLLKPPVFSWQQMEAEIPNCPEVEYFLRSHQLSTTFSRRFPTVNEARLWANEIFGFGFEVLASPDSQFFVNHRYSATVHVKKIAGGFAVCEITKNRRLFEYDVRQFELRQEEIAELIERRQMEIPHEPTARPQKRRKTTNQERIC
ncbi:uncharacterized protein LOC116918583 isoform X2 [Daphnia magna]|uniref:uncharacterized protein LOC116918583 isoform X2 n=1 Tax=Daphnia magna TaxID=35525 RepID=UPI001E1BDDE3|nr:uncharacterized protein LOC116918583 isoform X2 [Daphnia magna]